ncbi:hypothetical protein [Natrialba sp. SSL1]|uniref:hypothetical protein n=1 Tax=Natrialba sp. SSL1 TaxID=1869245 RepID=UPI0008F8E5BC|nr:hypothetical protein [Natrialba sp. SSL1]OIB56043.1 hypothetical protein BBD46_21355 [Natrialba sp. SSL1]
MGTGVAKAIARVKLRESTDEQPRHYATGVDALKPLFQPVHGSRSVATFEYLVCDDRIGPNRTGVVREHNDLAYRFGPENRSGSRDKLPN